MILFGEFLVKKGLISEEQLLRAVVPQMEMLPTIPALLEKHQLLLPNDILAALKFQTNNKVDFKRACYALRLFKTCSMKRKTITSPDW